MNFLPRELHEESGLHCDKLREVGRLMFEFVGDPQLLEVHVFTGTEYMGTPTESQGIVGGKAGNAQQKHVHN